ncbi:MAG: triose-phosphate isomerase [Thermoanaerobaculia bacterium]|nr:triose-phosphate isomerase [Thermoanaerobaculia bacterium]
MKRTPIVAGNWKMNLVSDEARALCRGIRERPGGEEVEVVVFPSHPLLPLVAESLEGTDVEWGGQDLSPLEPGAHTGDVAAVQLRDLGASWALAGHSERRRDHGESDELVAAKVAAAASKGLTPVLCLGETAEERSREQTFSVLARQLDVLTEPPPSLVVAYEPVWAIGTGDTATPEQAEAAHRFLRERFAGRLGEERGAALRILYGGSVKPHNAAELAAQPDIDGFLVGGASLDADSFLSIIEVFV